MYANALFRYRNTTLAQVDGPDSGPENWSTFRHRNWSRFSIPPIPFLGSHRCNVDQQVRHVWVLGGALVFASFGAHVFKPQPVSQLGVKSIGSRERDDIAEPRC